MRELFLPVVLLWNRARMRLPYGAACERCSVANPLVLIQDRPTICYRCDAESRGHPGEEEHHLGGRPSPFPPLSIDANVHRLLSDFQAVWRQRAIPPGHHVAVVLDLVFLVLMSSVWRTDGEAVGDG